MASDPNPILLRRHWVRLFLVPALSSTIVFFGWMVAFGTGWDWMENHGPVDPFVWVEQRAGPGFALAAAILLGFGVASLISCLAALWTLRWQGKRLLAFYRDTPACPRCDYNLSATETGNPDELYCPECGETWQRTSLRIRGWKVVTQPSSKSTDV